MAEETRDFTKRLEALDPRLALAIDEFGHWSIWRVPEDGSEERCIMRARTADAKLCPEVIEMLRSRDTRHGHDPVEEMILHNAKVVKDAEDAADEYQEEAIDHMMRKAWSGHRIPETFGDL